MSAGAGRGVQHGEGAASGDEGELAPWNTAAASTQPATMSHVLASVSALILVKILNPLIYVLNDSRQSIITNLNQKLQSRSRDHLMTNHWPVSADVPRLSPNCQLAGAGFEIVR